MKTQVKDFKSFVNESEKTKTRSGKLNEVFTMDISGSGYLAEVTNIDMTMKIGDNNVRFWFENGKYSMEISGDLANVFIENSKINKYFKYDQSVNINAKALEIFRDWMDGKL